MQMSTFSIVPSRHDHLKTQFLWSKLPSIQESVLPVLHHAPHSLIKLEEFPVQSIQLTVTKQHSENGSNAGLYCIKKKKKTATTWLQLPLFLHCVSVLRAMMQVNSEHI